MPTPAVSPAKLELRAAMEARDLDAVLDAFTPDGVIRSPFTTRVAFEGREQLAAIMQVVLDVLEDLRYTDEARDGDHGFLVGRARVGGADVEFVDHLRLAPDGRISELTVFFRPLPAAAVGVRVFGAALARRESRGRAAAISMLARPLGIMASAGDRVGARLVGAPRG
jgi:hypothetical protein